MRVFFFKKEKKIKMNYLQSNNYWAKPNSTNLKEYFCKSKKFIDTTLIVNIYIYIYK